jgi:hypothetical protein
MGGRTVISPTARGWRIRRRWRGQIPPDSNPIRALVHRRWLVEATCLGIPPERWVWQVTGWQGSAQAVEQVAVALGRGDPSPQPSDADLVEHIIVASKPVLPASHVGPVRGAAPQGGRSMQGAPRQDHTGQPPPTSPTPPTR